MLGFVVKFGGTAQFNLVEFLYELLVLQNIGPILTAHWFVSHSIFEYSKPQSQGCVL